MTAVTQATPHTRKTIDHGTHAANAGIFATHESREYLTNDQTSAGRGVQKARGLHGQASVQLFEKPSTRLAGHQGRHHALKQNQSVPALAPQSATTLQPGQLDVQNLLVLGGSRGTTEQIPVSNTSENDGERSGTYGLLNVHSEASNMEHLSARTRENCYADAIIVNDEASTASKETLGWSKFSRSKAAQFVKDPLARLAEPSDLSVQRGAKRGLRAQIDERDAGFLTNQNPILGDRYEHKLKQLQKKMDIAQEGKFTYD